MWWHRKAICVSKCFSRLHYLELDWCIEFCHSWIFFALVQQNNAIPKIRPFTGIHSVTTTYRSDIIEAGRDPYIETFTTLSGVRMLFWISLQLVIICTSAVKRYCAKNSSSFMHQLFSYVPEFTEAKTVPPSSLDLNLVNFLLWSTLQQKFHQEIRDVVTLLGPIRQKAIKGHLQWLLKAGSGVRGTQ